MLYADIFLTFKDFKTLPHQNKLYSITLKLNHIMKKQYDFQTP